MVIAAPTVVEDIVVSPRWDLTPAEERVVALAIRGDSNRLVSDTLSISEHTVEWHLRRVFAKLGVGSRSQLAARYAHDAAQREPWPGDASTGRSARTTG